MRIRLVYGLATPLMLVMMLLMSSSTSASQRLFKSNEIALVFCAYVRDDDTARLQHKLRDLRVRMRDMYTSIRCNNASLIQFALRNNSHNVGSFIARSVSIDALQEMGDYQWAREQELLMTETGLILANRIKDYRKD